MTHINELVTSGGRVYTVDAHVVDRPDPLLIEISVLDEYGNMQLNARGDTAAARWWERYRAERLTSARR